MLKKTLSLLALLLRLLPKVSWPSVKPPSARPPPLPVPYKFPSASATRPNDEAVPSGGVKCA